MKVFAFDPADYRDEYATRGWIHVREGIDPEFLDYLRDFVASSLESHHVEGKAISGTKQQALFEFPPEVDFPGHLFDVVAEVSGMRRATMTLSERHLKAYDTDTPAVPVAHKDRLASQCSVGLSIDIPADSRLVLYPQASREPNVFNVSAALLESLSPTEHPTVALRDLSPVEIADRPGDVVMFPGSTVWHARLNGAATRNLYLKFNDFGSDPLGEDPRTPQLRADTLSALRNGTIAAMIPSLSPRLDTIDRHYIRDGWREVIQARVWDERPLTLSNGELLLLRAIDGSRTVGDLSSAPIEGTNGTDVEGAIRRLSEHGVLDLRQPAA
jgi:hypothetical protein